MADVTITLPDLTLRDVGTLECWLSEALDAFGANANEARLVKALKSELSDRWDEMYEAEKAAASDGP